MRGLNWLWYTLARLAFVFVPLLILLWLGLNWILAAVLATAIGVVLSLAFLYRQRSALSTDLYQRKHRDTIDDGPSVNDPEADYENALLDDTSTAVADGERASETTKEEPSTHE